MAQGVTPALASGALASSDDRGPAFVPVSEEGEDGFWLETTLVGSEWSEALVPGVWLAPRPLLPWGAPSEGLAERLSVDGRAIPFVRLENVTDENFSAERRDFFAVRGDELFLVPPAGEGPPAEARLRTWIDPGRAVDGRWRVSLGDWTGDALPLLPGLAETRSVPPGGARILRFSTLARGEAKEARLRFRVLAGERELFAHEQAIAGEGAADHHVLHLAPTAAALELTFRVEGPPAHAAFLNPVLGPADPPADVAERPDLVLFLADTFRADSLAAWGGTEALTPHLDAFAQRSRRFSRAWSAAGWTIPSQASMMSGLPPLQHGATRFAARLSERARTVAEALSEAGYRTVAVTEGGFAGADYGFDQGFEWFEESRARWPEETYQETLAAARRLWNADDGRPTFLYVQTYRAHTPYHVTPGVLAEHGERLGVDAEWIELERAMKEGDRAAWKIGTPMPEDVGEILTRMRALYRGAVMDLDRGFGDFLAFLEGDRFLDSGYLLFTSDHGEAFGENADAGHGHTVWDHALRIPALLAGPGIAPGVESTPVSLVDLPLTLAALADVAPDPSWTGAPWTEPLEGRTIYGFTCHIADRESELAVMLGDRKLVRPLGSEGGFGEPRGAWDLGADPLERHDVLAEEAWVRALAERSAQEAPALLEPLLPREQSDPSAVERAMLEALGYVEGGDD